MTDSACVFPSSRLQTSRAAAQRPHQTHKFHAAEHHCNCSSQEVKESYGRIDGPMIISVHLVVRGNRSDEKEMEQIFSILSVFSCQLHDTHWLTTLLLLVFWQCRHSGLSNHCGCASALHTKVASTPILYSTPGFCLYLCSTFTEGRALLCPAFYPETSPRKPKLGFPSSQFSAES